MNPNIDNAPTRKDSCAVRVSFFKRVRGVARRVWIAGIFALMTAVPMVAQTGGEGAIEGTVLDSTGAVVPNATVTALNVATGVETTRPSTSAGFFSITPLIPGQYVVTVTAKGFEMFKQEKVTIDALHVTGLNVHLKPGAATETVTVTDAPPALETTNATLGGTIEGDVFTALPIVLQSGGSSNQQRDITQFSNLLPGAQVPPGGRSSIIGGTAQRLGEVYVDGLPLTTANQQGDNRPVYNVVPLEAIDQVQVITSGFSAEYQGAGLENYSTKSGTKKYHGSMFEYIRNTIFDAWTFSAKPGGGNTVSVPNATGTGFISVAGPKTPEHENEFGAAAGGPISIPHLFNGHDKLFFYGSYDKFKNFFGVNFVPTTVPTVLMRQGNFCELLVSSALAGGSPGGCGPASAPGYKVYDPTTQAACTAFYGTLCRYQYGYTHGASPSSAQVPNGQPINVVPANQISPISQAMAAALPAPVNGNLTNNYLGGTPTGYNNYIYSGRIDYDISDRNRVSFLLTGGSRHAVPYTGTTGLPYPYLSSTLSTVVGHFAEVEDSYTLKPNLVNQFKYGFMNFGGPPVQAPTQGTQYTAAKFGITGLPAGQASDDFPNLSFAGNSNNPTNWVGNNPSVTTVTETYEIVDNIQYVRGQHAMNFGIQYQWLEINADPQDTPSYQLPLTYSSNDTALPASATTVTSNTGYSYASFLLGAVNSSNVTQQPFSLYGGRFHNMSPYFQDDWKVRSNLTLNIGLRWDYMPSYRETLDRMTFLNPSVMNPVTGNAGSLQFAGNYGGAGVSCGCHNLVNTYFKNFGPRVAFAWSMDEKTVMRGGYALLYSHAGGVGGASGNNGTGSVGFSTSTSTPSYGAGTAPSFYLNTNPAFASVSGGPATPNSNYGGPGFTVVPPPAISAISQTTSTGFYACAGQAYAPCNGSTTAYGGTGAGISYADPYLGDRAPEISFFNFGMERQITKDMTINVNYVGTQSHFLAGSSLRGLQSGQINPAYVASVGPTNCGTTAKPVSCLVSIATPANIAAVLTQSGVALPVPYSSYTAAASLSTGASNTISHMLSWMPQYNGSTDTFGDVANGNYNAFELSLNQRFSKGLTFTVNYTYSRNIDDAGTSRSGWAIPAALTSDGRSWAPDRIDRSLSVNNLPELLTVFGVYKLPFGKGGIGASHFAVRALAGGWQISEIYQYASGLPLLIAGSGASTAQAPGQGTYMPDFNPNFHGSPRIHGSWGQGVTAANIGSLSYLQGYVPNTTAGMGTSSTTGDTAAADAVACGVSAGPFCNTQNYKIGNVTRVGADGLRGPNVYRVTMSASRTFDLTSRFKFVFRVDCQNVTNHTTFGNNYQNNTIVTNINTATFGTLGGSSADPRAFQLSGRINF